MKKIGYCLCLMLLLAGCLSWFQAWDIIKRRYPSSILIENKTDDLQDHVDVAFPSKSYYFIFKYFDLDRNKCIYMRSKVTGYLISDARIVNETELFEQPIDTCSYYISDNTTTNYSGPRTYNPDLPGFYIIEYKHGSFIHIKQLDTKELTYIFKTLNEDKTLCEFRKITLPETRSDDEYHQFYDKFQDNLLFVDNKEVCSI